MRADLSAIKRRFGIIGSSPLLDRAIEVAYQVAPTDLSVLVTGESGVGKEFFPQIIHQHGGRRYGPYVAVNCGAIPAGTIDSELFGHVKGAFTGAVENRKGYFEMAHEGTIFLDEVGELPLSTQAQLLRVLESGEYMRVGSSKVQKSDIRIVAATNVDLPDAIAHGRFREDLYYRLAAIPVFVPALRERGDDVLRLFRHFAQSFGERYQMPAVRLDESAERVVLNYRWPGNVRQLKNVTEQISILEQERNISAATLEHYVPAARTSYVPALYSPEEAVGGGERQMLMNLLQMLQQERERVQQLLGDLLEHGELTPQAQRIIQMSGLCKQMPVPTSGYPEPYAACQLEGGTRTAGALPPIEEVEAPMTLDAMEEEAIRRALRKHGQNRREAARELHISERTLYRKIKQYNLG